MNKILGKEIKIKNMDLIDALAKTGLQRFDIEKLPIRDLLEMIVKSNPGTITIQELEDAINDDFGFVAEIYEVLGQSLAIKNLKAPAKGAKGRA